MRTLRGVGAHQTCRRSVATSGILVRICALIIAIGAGLTSAAADSVRIHGSTTFNRELLEPFRSAIESATGHTLVVIPNKSGNGIVDLLEGRADIAMISAAMSTEIDLLRKERPSFDPASLIEHPIAQTRVAIAVHPTNQVRQLTLEQLRKLLTGDIKRWSELGAADLDISTAFVRTRGGVTSVVRQVVLGGQAISPAKPIAVDSPVQVVRIVAQEPGALGLSQVRLLKEHRLSEITVKPAVEQTLALVTKGPTAPMLQSVIQAVRNVANTQFAQ